MTAPGEHIPVLMDAVTIRQRIRAHVGVGARGILLMPSLHGFYGNDRRVWPVYEMAQSLRLPILAQTGDAGVSPPGGRGHWGRPRYFGDVAAGGGHPLRQSPGGHPTKRQPRGKHGDPDQPYREHH